MRLFLEIIMVIGMIALAFSGLIDLFYGKEETALLSFILVYVMLITKQLILPDEPGK